MTAPRRGEVWLVDLGMAAKVRPALVVTIPHTKLVRMLGKLGAVQLSAVERGVCLWFGLTPVAIR